MKTVVRAVRALVTLVVAVAVASSLASLSAEAVVAWYMQQYGIAQRADLANDMGFGMLGTLVQSTVALLSFVAALAVGWLLSGSVAAKLKR